MRRGPWLVRLRAERLVGVVEPGMERVGDWRLAPSASRQC
jgi:hypothetical protein